MLSGEWTPEREVFPADYYSGYAFAIALDAAGHPILVFERQDPRSHFAWVLYWTRYDGESWSSISRVSPSDNSPPSKPRLGLDKDGKLWLVWRNVTSGGIWYAVFGAGQWSNPARVHPPNAYEQYSPIVAQGGGAIWCAWYGTSDTGHHYDVFLSQWTGTAWSPPENLTAEVPGWHWFVDLKVDSQGQPHLVWGNTDENQVYFAMKPSGGGWTSPERISETPVSGWPECRLALDEADEDHVVWVTGTGVLAYANRTPSGWSSEQMYPPIAYGPLYPAIACGGGQVTTVWTEFNGEEDQVFAMEPGQPVARLDGGSWFYQQTTEIIAGADSLWTFWVVYDEWQTKGTFLYSTRPLTAPVPVQITFASAHREQAGVVLEWRTGESNPGTFYVDRELPGQTRERISDAVDPIGTGYSCLDASAPPAGTKYYLELLDRAGGTTYFGPYELLDGPGVLGVGAQLTASPNPFRADVKLTARNLPAGDLSIEVCSVAGRILHSEPPIAGFGGGAAELGIPNLDALPAGLYFVRVRIGAISVTTKVVKIE
jgi:hypothetical protein